MGAAVSAGSSPGATRTPVWPSAITAGMPPTAVDTIASSLAIASISAIGSPSVRDEMAYTSIAASSAGTSVRLPSTRIASRAGDPSATALTSASIFPPPAITRTARSPSSGSAARISSD